jgi:hypothetical protein
METNKFTREGPSRNRENNPILSRWQEVLSARKGEAAIFAPDGTILRTFGLIEEEARRWEEQLARHNSSGAVCLQIGNRAEWPALVIAVWRSGRTVLPLELEISEDRRCRIEHSCGAVLRIVPSAAGVKTV